MENFLCRATVGLRIGEQHHSGEVKRLTDPPQFVEASLVLLREST